MSGDSVCEAPGPVGTGALIGGRPSRARCAYHIGHEGPHSWKASAKSAGPMPAPLDPATVVLDMDALTERQRDVLSAIAVDEDGGHPSAVLRVLAEKGLIVGREVPVAGWPPMTVMRWQVPLPVHMQWAAWCSRQPEVADD